MTCPNDLSHQPGTTVTRSALALWNQFAPRLYMQVALCFPFVGSRKEAEDQIKASLCRLKYQQPAYAANLEADSEGRVYLVQRPSDDISFNAVDYAADFPFHEYEQLKREGFPSNAFVHPNFLCDGSLRPARLVPACQISASFLDGGIILWVSIHHSLTDGAGLGGFLACLAAHTRCSQVNSGHEIGLDSISSQALVSKILRHKLGGFGSCFEGLLRECHEYKKVPTATSSFPRANLTLTPRGNIFVFQNKRLNEAKDLIEARSPGKRPSTFVIIATLIWVHITKARLMTETPAPENEDLKHAILQLCVEWRERTFHPTSKHYYGVRSLQHI